jgi:hypothetical protein
MEGFGPESLVTDPKLLSSGGSGLSIQSVQDGNPKSPATLTHSFTSIIPQTFGLRSIRYNNAGMTVKNSVFERIGMAT